MRSADPGVGGWRAARRVVFAPDSFKGSITAVEAADALARGWRSVRPGDELLRRPMADGGEGSMDAFGVVAGAERRSVRVSGPDGRAVDADWLLLPDGAGVVELAATSGLTLLEAPLPLDATTLGLGQAIAVALDAGADPLLIAVGGSASTDGGAGLLQALGARLLDARGRPIAAGSRGLAAVDVVDLGGLRPPPSRGATVLTDVAAPLTGPAGAAAVFGPQKGASPGSIPGMDAALGRFAAMLGGDPAEPGAGAAGGAAFGLARWGARIAPGGALIADRIGLPGAIRGADLVVTGEGRFDATSRSGKVAGTVLRLARDAGVPVALVAGSIAARTEGFAIALDLSRTAGGAARAMARPAAALEAAGAALAETSDR